MLFEIFCEYPLLFPRVYENIYRQMMEKISREEIIGKASDLKVIPTLNGIVEKVFHVLGDNNTSFNDLCEIVQYDQAISSKIISIANSAYYSRGVEIFNLQRAMLTIGFDEVRGIITCLMFVENILKKLKLKEQDLLTLWRHAINVACGARILSEKLLIEDPPKVYTVALLHDLGKIVFFLSSDRYSELLKAAVGKGKSIAELERETFGTDHQEIGHIVAVKWKFPADFVNVIRYHHSIRGEDQQTSLIKLVTAADRFTYSINDNSTEGFILEKEKLAIRAEVEKIMNFLQLG